MEAESATPEVRPGVAAALALCCLLALAGCLPRQAAEALLLRSHFDRIMDLPYGSAPRQRLDVYRPKKAQRGMPVIVFLYGGRWQHGSKHQYRLLGDAITRRGIVAVIPDYRLYPDVSFPVWVRDAAQVVRWVHDSVHHFGGNPAQIFVVGHSSGAHSAALLALDEQYLRDAGLSSSFLRGVVSLAGPVATTWTDPDVQALMGPRERWLATYPIKHVDGSEPPFLLLHGARDHVVAPANSVRLGGRIRERGGCARVITYGGLDHVAIVIAASVPRLGVAPILDKIATFVQQPRAVCRREPQSSIP